MTRPGLRPSILSPLGALLLFGAPGCWVSKVVEDDPAVARDCAERTAYYRDADADTYGSDLDVVLACAVPDGYAAVGGDCDDADPTRAADCTALDSGADTGTDTGAGSGADTGSGTDSGGGARR